MSSELLDTQVNPAVWEISGHMVLKRRIDFEDASEDNAWRLLAEVSLSEERFQEVNSLIFAFIRNGETATSAEGEVDDKDESVKQSSVFPPRTRIVGVTECLVQP